MRPFSQGMPQGRGRGRWGAGARRAASTVTATLAAAAVALTACSGGTGSASPTPSLAPAPGSGEVVTEQALSGFKRLANAGNGKDVMVVTGHGWEVFNAGIQAKAHGDHVHNYASEPGMTGVTFPGGHAGHVVTHHGQTTLFADGTGRIQTFESAHLDKATRDLMPVMEETTTAPHHGVALELADGSLLMTQGTEESRDTVQVVDRASGEVRAETDDGHEGHDHGAEPSEGHEGHDH